MYCLVQLQYFLHSTYMVCIRHMLHAEVQDDLVPDVELHVLEHPVCVAGGGHGG